MRKEYTELKKIVKNEGGVIVGIQKHDRMDKVKINFGGDIVNYNFSTSKHCNFQNMVRSQIRRLKNKRRKLIRSALEWAYSCLLAKSIKTQHHYATLSYSQINIQAA